MTKPSLSCDVREVVKACANEFVPTSGGSCRCSRFSVLPQPDSHPKNNPGNVSMCSSESDTAFVASNDGASDSTLTVYTLL